MDVIRELPLSLEPPMSIEEQIRKAIEASITNANVVVSGNGGHLNLRVESIMFEGKKTLEKQRMVYSAIKELMAGNNAPVHAIDRLETLIP